MADYLAKIRNLFVPRWRSSNPDERLAAIDELQESSSEDLEALKHLASEDASKEIRGKALKKLNALPALLSILPPKSGPGTNSDLSEADTKEVRSELLQRIALLLSAEPRLFFQQIEAEQRAELLNEFDETLGVKLLSHADKAQMIEALLASKNAQLRAAAIARIDQQDELKEIEKQFKNKDKRAFQLAREKLKWLREQQAEANRRKADAEAIIDSLQRLEKSAFDRHSESKFEVLLQRWDKLHTVTPESPSHDDDPFHAFYQTKAAIEQKLQAQREEKAEAEHQAERLRAAQKELDSTIAVLAQTLGDIQKKPETDSSHLAALDGLIKTQQIRWDELKNTITPPEDAQNQYMSLIRTLTAYMKAAGLLNSYRAELDNNTAGDTNGISENDKQSWRSRIKWPAEIPTPSLLTELSETAANSTLEKTEKEAPAGKTYASSQHVQQLLEKLEEALEARNLTEAKAQMKRVQQGVEELSELDRRAIQGRLSLAQKQLQELQDWRGFASTPKQIELCETMEKLASTSMEPSYKAEKIKALQTEWKKLGGTQDQSLWLRFKHAADEAYLPCKAYFDEQDALKTLNLKRREKILAELKSLLDSIKWDKADFRLLDKISRSAKQEWKAAIPIDHRKNRSLQKTFNSAIGKIDKELQIERNQNLLEKKRLVDQAQSLVKLEPLKDATQQAKQLQKEWSSIGITEHRKDRALWREFREHCDAVFARIHAAKDARKQEEAALIDKLSASVERAKELALNPSDAALKEIRTLLQEASSIGVENTEKKDAEHQLKELQQATEKELNNQVLQKSKQSWLNAIHLSKHIEESADINTLNDELATFKEACDQTERRLVEVIDAKYAFKTGTGETIVEEPPEPALSKYSGNDLCLLMEINCGAESPNGQEARRMELQVMRLNAGIQGGREVRKSKFAQIQDILVAWLYKTCKNQITHHDEIIEQHHRLLKSITEVKLDELHQDN